MKLFLHIVNPVQAPPSSDLYRAQPITFQSMQVAKSFAESSGVSVLQCAAFYEEDRLAVPTGFSECPVLTRSCSDFATMTPPRRLPLLADILDRGRDATAATYVIYTNVDIALMPHFYVTADYIMRQGYDAITICRRTLSQDYKGVEELPRMYADMGVNHPGTDCFIVKRELLEQFDLQNVVIGAQFVAFALRVNLHLFAKHIKEFPSLHMTFHIGDDRAWASQRDYSSFNAREVDAMFNALAARADLANPEKLKLFREDFNRRKEKALG